LAQSKLIYHIKFCSVINCALIIVVLVKYQLKLCNQIDFAAFVDLIK